ncbi:MAG: hypothetical protein U0797_17500 [Gemmataceae bacterium]
MQRLAGWIIGVTGLVMVVQVVVPEYRKAMSDGALTADDVPALDD